MKKIGFHGFHGTYLGTHEIPCFKIRFFFHDLNIFHPNITMKTLGFHGFHGFDVFDGIGLREKDVHQKLHIFLHGKNRAVRFRLSHQSIDGIKTGPSLLLKTTIHCHKQ